MSSFSQQHLVAIGVIVVASIALYIHHKSQQSNSVQSISNQSKNDTKSKCGDNRLVALNQNGTVTLQLPPRLVLITDIDHTLIGQNTDETHHESNAHILRLNDIWCTQYAPNNSIWVYATGRNYKKYQKAAAEWDIVKPDILVAADGVTIHWFNKSLAQRVRDTLDDPNSSLHGICESLKFRSVISSFYFNRIFQFSLISKLVSTK